MMKIGAIQHLSLSLVDSSVRPPNASAVMQRGVRLRTLSGDDDDCDALLDLGLVLAKLRELQTGDASMRHKGDFGYFSRRPRPPSVLRRRCIYTATADDGNDADSVLDLTRLTFCLVDEESM